jgi:hypothetical protein
LKNDGEIGCAIITPASRIRKRLQPQNILYSAEEEAIIKAIRVSEWMNLRRKNTFLLVLGHMEKPRHEAEYPPQSLTNWIKTEGLKMKKKKERSYKIYE